LHAGFSLDIMWLECCTDEQGSPKSDKPICYIFK